MFRWTLYYLVQPLLQQCSVNCGIFYWQAQPQCIAMLTLAIVRDELKKIPTFFQFWRDDKSLWGGGDKVFDIFFTYYHIKIFFRNYIIKCPPIHYTWINEYILSIRQTDIGCLNNSHNQILLNEEIYNLRKNKLGLSCAKLSSSWLQAYTAYD